MPALEHPPQRAAARDSSPNCSLYESVCWTRMRTNPLVLNDFFPMFKIQIFFVFFLALFFSLSLTLARARKDSLLFLSISRTHSTASMQSTCLISHSRPPKPPPPPSCPRLIFSFDSKVTLQDFESALKGWFRCHHSTYVGNRCRHR